MRTIPQAKPHLENKRERYNTIILACAHAKGELEYARDSGLYTSEPVPGGWDGVEISVKL